HAGDIFIDLGRGPVRVRIPSSYDPAVPMPVVMTIHGYSGTGAWQEGYFGVTALAESMGFIYVVPDGTVDLVSNQFWNGTNACCDFYGTGVDDSSYLRALLEEIDLQLAVDRRRVHLLGHSNGGFMAHRMACEHADLIASIASLAGATWEDASVCTPSEPVHILQIHGTSDGTVLFNGGHFGGQVYPSALGTVERWASKNGCDLIQDTSAPNINLDGGIPGQESSVTRWLSNCDLGGSAELWTISGGGHIPNLSNPFIGHVIGYLLEHPKPGAGTNFCSASANSTGAAAAIRGEGSNSISAADLVLAAESVPANQNGLFYYGANEIVLPFGNGTRCVAAGGGSLYRLPIQTSDGAGRMALALQYTGNEAQLSAGTTWKFQAWFRDPGAGGSSFDLSDGLSIVFRP
ncbi:MAG: polyhydroxybutyrate depolymerase, partial [Planctomycetota bacterium]